jgi:hypothetical protein
MKTFAVALLLGAVVFATGFAGKAFAAEDAGNTAQAAPAVKHYDFEDDQVEGDLQRPDGFLVMSIPKAKEKSLIELRTSFIPEIIKSLEDL